MRKNQIVVDKKILHNLVGTYSLEMNCDDCPFGHGEHGMGLCVGMGWNDDNECYETLMELLKVKEV